MLEFLGSRFLALMYSAIGRLWVLVIAFLAFSLFDMAQAARVVNEAPASKPFVANAWQNVLSQSVDEEGRVDFFRLKAQPRRVLQALDQIKGISPVNHPEYFETQQDQLAFWVNAYNTISLALILDRYPIEDISQVPNLMDDTRYSVGNIPMSLSMIQDRIEKQFAAQPAVMPRALFALSLYSEDSPPVPLQVYQGSLLKQQLETQAKRFMSLPQNLRVIQGEYGLNPNSSCAVLRLSPWFAQVRQGIERSFNSRPNVTSKLTTPKALFEMIKPYLAPEDYARMMVRCAHGIGYFPPNPTLRSSSQMPSGSTKTQPMN